MPTKAYSQAQKSICNHSIITSSWGQWACCYVAKSWVLGWSSLLSPTARGNKHVVVVTGMMLVAVINTSWGGCPSVVAVIDTENEGGHHECQQHQEQEC